MKIVIAGGTGFLGGALTRALDAQHHEIVILTRAASGSRANARSVTWTPDGLTGPWASEIDGAGAIINLAGESIAARRWSAAHKRRVLDSRLDATRSLVAAIRNARQPPAVFVSGSAVGYYGSRGDEVLTEEAAPGDDFLAHVCQRWEAEALRAATDRTRVVCVRTGLVLARDGGALPPMLFPFKLGVGGPVGSGRQYWPWIHRDDWVGVVSWALSAGVAGPLNATAPEPVTNAEFARALGRAMHRPALLPAPAIALRAILGEMADALILSGQRAVPRRAEHGGYAFQYRQAAAALAAIFKAS